MYTIPKQIRITCAQTDPDAKKCGACKLAHKGSQDVITVPESIELLELVRTPKEKQTAVLRDMAGIPKCSAFAIETLQPQNVEEILLAPEVAYSRDQAIDEQYSLQRAFFLAGLAKTVVTNQSYRVVARRLQDPWQQYATFLITEIEPLQDSVVSFRMTPEIREKLKVFQTGPDRPVEAVFRDIHQDLTYNVTRIYGRYDLLTALDLVYHSVLRFVFQDSLVTRGWLECLVIGDTRTGKSETAEKLIRHYGLGEMVFGENTSFAGLVGGMQQTQSRWFITWGKIPLNNRRLVVIDEVSGLSTDDISRMSGIRSSGIAEVTKIQTERALAQTRLIWLSNPRSGSPLSSYAYGVEAIAELIGKSEDIARFDFAISCASNEVPSSIINQEANAAGRPNHVYTGELCRLLVLWAWSRTPDQIVFEPEATSLVLREAIRMGKEYSANIPLVEAANQRIKIARMSVATAARVFSTDENGEKVIVKPEHVRFAVDFMDQAYKKPSLAYYAYSQVEKENERVAAQFKDEVVNYVRSFPELGELFLRQHYVSARDLEEQLSIDRDVAKEHLTFLARKRMITRTTGGYRKTPAFITLLRNWKQS